MLDIKHVQDMDTLRQVAGLLERENSKLHERLKQLLHENARLRGQDAAEAQRELELLLKKISAPSAHPHFAHESEKRSHTQDESSAQKPAQRGHGPRSQPELIQREVLHTLPAEDRQCPVCDGTLTELGEQTEDAEEITVVERQFVLVTHKRQKYRCKCNASVVTAPAPVKLWSGSRYSIEFAIEVAVSKFLDHMPLERQCRTMRREGLRIDSQTLWDQTHRLFEHLQPVLVDLRSHVWASPLIFADETGWKMMQQGSHRWWLWEIACEDAVYHKIFDSRGTECARELLDGYDGVVMADGYSAYKSLLAEGAAYKIAHCWAHVRRRFHELENVIPGVAVVLDLIGQLYHIESEVPDIGIQTSAQTRNEILALRAKLRSDRSKPIVQEILEWIYGQSALPGSDFGKALRYPINQWKGLTQFLKDPRIPLDNNAAERGLRGAVVGRKNHYGSRSKRGAEVTSLFYSLLESAKLCGIEPKSYLLETTKRIILDKNDILLPHQVATR